MTSNQITFLILTILTIISVWVLVHNYFIKRHDDWAFGGWFSLVIIVFMGWLVGGGIIPLGVDETTSYNMTDIVNSNNKIYVELIKDTTYEELQTIVFIKKEDFDNIDNNTVFYKQVSTNMYGLSAGTTKYYYENNDGIKKYSDE